MNNIYNLNKKDIKLFNNKDNAIYTSLDYNTLIIFNELYSKTKYVFSVYMACRLLTKKTSKVFCFDSIKTMLNNIEKNKISDYKIKNAIKLLRINHYIKQTDNFMGDNLFEINKQANINQLHKYRLHKNMIYKTFYFSPLSFKYYKEHSKNKSLLEFFNKHLIANLFYNTPATYSEIREKTNIRKNDVQNMNIYSEMNKVFIPKHLTYFKSTNQSVITGKIYTNECNVIFTNECKAIDSEYYHYNNNDFVENDDFKQKEENIYKILKLHNKLINNKINAVSKENNEIIIKKKDKSRNMGIEDICKEKMNEYRIKHETPWKENDNKVVIEENEYKNKLNEILNFYNASQKQSQSYKIKSSKKTFDEMWRSLISPVVFQVHRSRVRSKRYLPYMCDAKKNWICNTLSFNYDTNILKKYINNQ